MKSSPWSLSGLAVMVVISNGCRKMEPPIEGRPEPAVQKQELERMPEAGVPAKEEPKREGAVSGFSLELQRGTLRWEQRVDQILSTPQLNDSQRAKLLMKALSTFPEEGLSEATRQAVDRLSDEDYAVASYCLINPQTHGMIQSVLFADLLERPDSITLPTLLAIARNPSHPFAATARNDLGLLLDKDFGSDWLAWELAVTKALKNF